MTMLMPLRRILLAKMVARNHGILRFLLRPTPAWMTSSATSSPPRPCWRTTSGRNQTAAAKEPLPHPLCGGGADPPAAPAEADRSHQDRRMKIRRTGGRERPRGQPGTGDPRGEDRRAEGSERPREQPGTDKKKHVVKCSKTSGCSPETSRDGCCSCAG